MGQDQIASNLVSIIKISLKFAGIYAADVQADNILG